ncbi:MAG: transcription elongation factor Spt5 [Nanoarchaeota archaeon]
MDSNIDNHEYYVVRTVPSKEEKFMESIKSSLSKKENHGIYAFFRPETVKGYIFIETQNLSSAVDALRGIPNSKGVIRTPLDFIELEKYFEKDGEQVVVNERDIVEIIAGPFKGDKAKVVRIVPGKDEVIIEPLNVPVPIPITLNIEDVRLIESSDKDE